ncbi:MAG: CxxC-x17-CxxC domain-containing protein [Syntrophaceticus sp.]
MFKATCAKCGQETEVPFRPSSDRPVYCRECYQASKSRW